MRTGRWHRVRDKGQWNFVQKAAGMHASVAKWLKERDVAAIGCDGVSDVMPLCRCSIESAARISDRRYGDAYFR